METSTNQLVSPETETDETQDTIDVTITLYNLTQITSSTRFNRYPIPAGDIVTDGNPYAIFSLQNPISVSSGQTIKFILQSNDAGITGLDLTDFVKTYTSGSSIAESQEFPNDNDRKLLPNEGSVTTNHNLENGSIEAYDIWFEFTDSNGNLQRCLIDPKIQVDPK